MLGITYFHLGNYDTAKKWFLEAFQLNFEDYNSQTYLGHIEFNMGNYEDALFRYLHAITVSKIPRDEEYLGLGNTYLKLEKNKRALEMFQKAYGENKRNDIALFEYALASDRYYEDKKISYKLYETYLKEFTHKKDSVRLNFIKSRMGAIKEKLFLEGKLIEE